MFLQDLSNIPLGYRPKETAPITQVELSLEIWICVFDSTTPGAEFVTDWPLTDRLSLNATARSGEENDIGKDFVPTESVTCVHFIPWLLAKGNPIDVHIATGGTGSERLKVYSPQIAIP